MKRFFCVAAMFMLSLTPLAAQSFKSGVNLATASLEVGSDYGVPTTLSYEYGLQDINDVSSIGIGAMMGYGRESNTIYSTLPGSDGSTDIMRDELISRCFYTGALMNYHYTGVDNFDFTGGAILGYSSESIKYKGDSGSKESDDSLLFRLNVGARYYFTDKFSIVGTVDVWGVDTINIGVGYKW